MKKIVSLLTLISVFVVSCEKNEKIYSGYKQTKQNDFENIAIPIVDNTKSQGIGGQGSYNWKVRTGHSAASCRGCITIEGVIGHADCMGHGTECSATASVVLSAIANAQLIATTIDRDELTTENLFSMPNRSLYVGMDGNKEIWLNVPEQLVTRDKITEQFEFEGLFFTDYQVYGNE